MNHRLTHLPARLLDGWSLVQARLSNEGVSARLEQLLDVQARCY